MRPLAPSKLAHFVYVFEATDQPQQVTTELNQLFDCQFDNTLVGHEPLWQSLMGDGYNLASAIDSRRRCLNP